MDSSAATVSLSKAITSLSARQKTRNTPQSDTEGDEALSMVITSCLNADQDRDQLLVYMFAVATAPSNVAMPQIARLATCKAFESEDSQILVTFLTVSAVPASILFRLCLSCPFPISSCGRFEKQWLE